MSTFEKSGRAADCEMQSQEVVDLGRMERCMLMYHCEQLFTIKYNCEQGVQYVKGVEGVKGVSSHIRGVRPQIREAGAANEQQAILQTRNKLEAAK